MKKEEMEQYVEELYAMHKDLSDIHRESIERIFDLTRSNIEVINRAEKHKKEIEEEVGSLRGYCNVFTIIQISLLMITIFLFGWKFDSFSDSLKSNLYVTSDEFKKVVKVQEEQNKVLARIEALEKNRMDKESDNTNKFSKGESEKRKKEEKK